jgi:hypothetical protein
MSGDKDFLDALAQPELPEENTEDNNVTRRGILLVGEWGYTDEMLIKEFGGPQPLADVEFEIERDGVIETATVSYNSRDGVVRTVK